MTTRDTLHSFPLELATRLGPALTSALIQCIEERDTELDSKMVAAAFRAGLICAVGEVYATAILAELTDDGAGKSYAEVARELGLTRQAVSKMMRRCRKNFGLPELRIPNNSRSGMPAHEVNLVKSPAR